MAYHILLPWYYFLDVFNARWIQTCGSTSLTPFQHINFDTLCSKKPVEPESGWYPTTLKKTKFDCLKTSIKDFPCRQMVTPSHGHSVYSAPSCWLSHAESKYSAEKWRQLQWGSNWSQELALANGNRHWVLENIFYWLNWKMSGKQVASNKLASWLDLNWTFHGSSCWISCQHPVIFKVGLKKILSWNCWQYVAKMLQYFRFVTDFSIIVCFVQLSHMSTPCHLRWHVTIIYCSLFFFKKLYNLIS